MASWNIQISGGPATSSIYFFPTDERQYCIGLMIWWWYVLYVRTSTMTASLTLMTKTCHRAKQIILSERTTGGQPAVSEKVEVDGLGRATVQGADVDTLSRGSSGSKDCSWAGQHPAQNITGAFVLINTTYNYCCLYSILTRHVIWTHKRPYHNHLFCQVVFHHLNLCFGAWQ